MSWCVWWRLRLARNQLFGEVAFSLSSQICVPSLCQVLGKVVDKWLVRRSCSQLEQLKCTNKLLLLIYLSIRKGLVILQGLIERKYIYHYFLTVDVLGIPNRRILASAGQIDIPPAHEDAYVYATDYSLHLLHAYFTVRVRRRCYLDWSNGQMAGPRLLNCVECHVANFVLA